MTWAVTLPLVAALIGLPLGIATTHTTLALAGGAGLAILVGVLLRSSHWFTFGVAISVVEALLAFLQSGKPTNVFPALLLGIIIYVLLDVSTFFTAFHGVSLDASVLRGKAAYWGGVSLLVGLVGLTIALLASLLSHPLSHPLLSQPLSVLSTVIAVGAVLGALRMWRTRVSDVFKRPEDQGEARPT
jgi:hypothetical protein